MKQEQFKLESEQGRLKILIAGDLTEDSQFPKLKPELNQAIVLHMKDVGYISSSGIQRWILWMRSLKQDFKTSPLVFQHLPSIFVRQAKQIKGLVPDGSAIESFAIPYFCEKCGKSITVLFEKGTNWDVSWGAADIVNHIKETRCPVCGTLAEIDASPDNYAQLQAVSEKKATP